MNSKKRGVGKTPRMIAFWSEISNGNWGLFLSYTDVILMIKIL